MSKKIHVAYQDGNNVRILTNPAPEQIPPGAVTLGKLPKGEPPHLWKLGQNSATVMSDAEVIAKKAAISRDGIKPARQVPAPVGYTEPGYKPEGEGVKLASLDAPEASAPAEDQSMSMALKVAAGAAATGAIGTALYFAAQALG